MEMNQRPAQSFCLKMRGNKVRLQDKVAIVTGGAAGIGRATAERFIEEGAWVVICDMNEEAGKKAASELGDRADFHLLDVANRKAVKNCFDEIAKHYQGVDILINNAGILRDSLLVKVRDGEIVQQMTEDDFDMVVSVNLKGVFNCTQVIAPAMIKRRAGVVLNASSIAGLDGNFGQTNYVATKAGVVGMTKVWARELGRYNIRVNAVAPGFTVTELVMTVPANIIEGMKARTPLGRLGDPRDIANAYLFLASEEAAFITGAVLRVDGGLVIGT